MLMVLPSQFQLRLIWYNMEAAYVLLFRHIYSRVGDASRHLLQLDLATRFASLPTRSRRPTVAECPFIKAKDKGIC